ncbi:conjugal transfer protein TraD, partial [Sinorhizobium medicae]
RALLLGALVELSRRLKSDEGEAFSQSDAEDV